MSQTRSYIKWTDTQYKQVLERLIQLICLKFAGRNWFTVPSDMFPLKDVRPLVRQAQGILEPDFHKNQFHDSLLTKLSEDALRTLRRGQKDHDKEEAKTKDLEKRVTAASGLPIDELVEELARRLTKHITEQVLLSIRSEALGEVRKITGEMVGKEIDRVKQMLHHNPIAVNSDPKTFIPTYVIVGAMKKQFDILEKEFEGRAKLVLIEQYEYGRSSANCKGKIVFCMRFVDHGIHNSAKKLAEEFYFVDGGVSVLRVYIERRLAEFHSLNP